MKAMFLSIFLQLFLSCQAETNIEASETSLAKINGQWQFTKKSVGYPVPGGPTEIKAINTEIISFDASSKIFTRTINGKLTETTDFDVQKLNLFGAEPKEAVVFTKNQNYSFLTFDDTSSSIILYEKTPIGAVLADGNSYYYQKVK
jgi:hypothetical protein